MKRKVWATEVLLLAVALTPIALIGQTASPAARQGSPSSAASPSSGSASSSSPGTTTPSAPGANSSTSGDCGGEPCPQTPTPHITIATPAPAPAPWPVQDRIRWAAEILLAIIAYVGVMLAVSTLRKIERQTRYVENAAQSAADAAKSALHYAEAHARSERPWILISAEPATGSPDSFTVVATNRGRGPAKIVALEDGIAGVKDEADLPADPVYKNDDTRTVPPAMILLPGESTTIRAFRRDDVPSFSKSPEEMRRIENWEEKIYLFGKVTYLDLHTPDEKQTYETGWCCWYIHGRQKSGMVMAGPQKYNRHT